MNTDKVISKEIAEILDKWWVKIDKTEYGYQVKEYIKKNLSRLIKESGMI